MHRNFPLLAALCLLAAGNLSARGDTVWQQVQVVPSVVRLDGADASCTLLVTGTNAAGELIDVTHDSRYTSQDPRRAAVSATGLVRARPDGDTTIQVSAGGKVVTIAVHVTGTQRPRQFHFENDILPILSRHTCNSSGCHGKAEGQNGFKLSVFGFDPPADFAALTKEARGRRVLFSAPEHSLLLTKVSGAVAHGGGLRIPRSSSDYETLRQWIVAGAPFGKADVPRVVSIQVSPRERSLPMRGQQQLRVVARGSDGREFDVTVHAKFQANQEKLARVSASGLVEAGDVPGEAAVMVSYMNCVDVFRALLPRSERIDPYPEPPANNFIDPLVFRSLKKLRLLASEPADDATYLRRVYLDVIGTLPTAAEARRFLADTRADRRARLVDDLVARPEFADYWAMKWADLLRVDRQALGHKGAYRYYQWIRSSIAANKPLDRFAREVLTAEGPLAEVGPAQFYRAVKKPGDQASALAQVFLGVRMACGQCHHHPYDRWSQDDYYGMAAFFAPLNVRGTVGEEMLMASGAAPTHHPRTNAVMHAHALGTPMPDADKVGERRPALAEWLTAPNNPWFARNLANRAWAHFLGHGLVDPVDDWRATNPPSNPELVDALAKHLVDSRFDFRQLVRTITGSRIYQLSSTPNVTNEKDEQNFSRARLRRLDAEVLLDMVGQATGVGERFEGMPPGTRAIQLWDSKVPHYFLKLFGRPQRTSACACERISEPGVAQVLHLLNAAEINAKFSHERGKVAELVRKHADDKRLTEEFYLAFYSRLPTEAEMKAARAHLAKDPAQRRQAAEDLSWSLLNSLEFGFNH